jgi:hypothetical protein
MYIKLQIFNQPTHSAIDLPRAVLIAFLGPCQNNAQGLLPTKLTGIKM